MKKSYNVNYNIFCKNSHEFNLRILTEQASEILELRRFPYLFYVIYDIILYDKTWRDVIWCNIIWYVKWYDMIYDMIYDVMWYDMMIYDIYDMI